MKAHKWILAKHFHGLPKDSDLEMIEVDLPEVKEGGASTATPFLYRVVMTQIYITTM